MGLIQANPGPLRWSRGSFRPHGRIQHYGPRPLRRNARVGLGDTVPLAGRLIVGFNVDDEPRWEMEDAIEIVKRVRQQQVGDPSASFIAQEGIYMHREGDRVVEEDSAQVVIIDTHGTPSEEFVAQMEEAGNCAGARAGAGAGHRRDPEGRRDAGAFRGRSGVIHACKPRIR